MHICLQDPKSIHAFLFTFRWLLSWALTSTPAKFRSQAEVLARLKPEGFCTITPKRLQSSSSGTESAKSTQSHELCLLEVKCSVASQSGFLGGLSQLQTVSAYLPQGAFGLFYACNMRASSLCQALSFMDRG